MNYEFLAQTSLFQGIEPGEIGQMLKCLGTKVQEYEKEEMIYGTGQRVEAVGMVLSGSVYVEKNDIWGRRSVMDRVGEGEIFAETYACISSEPLMVDVVAAQKCRILFLNMKQVFLTCAPTCGHHSKLLRNLLLVSAQKNLNLSRRTMFITPKTIRERLLAYLSSEAARRGGREFTIPFNRQHLADYLNVDRSAMSKELGEMQKEGLLVTNKNYFKLLIPPRS